MAVITNNLCGYQPPEGGKTCTRRIKADEFRCYQHKNLRASGDPAPLITPDEIEKRREIIASLAEAADATKIVLGTPKGLRRSLIMETTPIAGDALTAVDTAADRLDVDLFVPSNAHDAYQDFGNDKFIQFLKDEGIAANRISTMRVSGLNYLKRDGFKAHAAEHFYEAILIDADTPNEVVVDPFIARFATGINRRVSVDEQLPSGETPFADLPWIGTVRSYVDGDHVWFDKFDMKLGERVN